MASTNIAATIGTLYRVCFVVCMTGNTDEGVTVYTERVREVLRVAAGRYPALYYRCVVGMLRFTVNTVAGTAFASIGVAPCRHGIDGRPRTALALAGRMAVDVLAVRID